MAAKRAPRHIPYKDCQGCGKPYVVDEEKDEFSSWHGGVGYYFSHCNTCHEIFMKLSLARYFGKDDSKEERDFEIMAWLAAKLVKNESEGK